MNVPLSIASQCQPPWVPTHSLTYTSLATEVARGDWKYEIPPEWRWELLVTILDSVGYQFSSIEWLQANQHMVISIWDEYHREWNAVKQACKADSFGMFRYLLYASIVMNVQFGPFGTGDNYHQKREGLSSLLDSSNAGSAWFQDAMPEICADRGIVVPDSPDGQAALFESLSSAPSFYARGPPAKMMQWFSVLKAWDFHEPDLFLTREVFRCVQGMDGTGEVDDVLFVPDAENSKENHQLEVRKLRQSSGHTMRLSARLITPELRFAMRRLRVTAAALWSSHGARAKHKLDAHENAEYCMKLACGGWVTSLRRSLLSCNGAGEGCTWVESFL